MEERRIYQHYPLDACLFRKRAKIQKEDLYALSAEADRKFFSIRKERKATKPLIRLRKPQDPKLVKEGMAHPEGTNKPVEIPQRPEYKGHTPDEWAKEFESALKYGRIRKDDSTYIMAKYGKMPEVLKQMITK